MLLNVPSHIQFYRTTLTLNFIQNFDHLIDFIIKVIVHLTKFFDDSLTKLFMCRYNCYNKHTLNWYTIAPSQSYIIQLYVIIYL